MTSKTPPSYIHPNLSMDEALYNHLVLPPQLPHRQDPNTTEIEGALLERAILSAQCMRDLPENEHYSTWDAVARSLQTVKTITPGGNVDRSVLALELKYLKHGDFLVVHVQSQNCALFVYRSKDPALGPSVVFEAFEASARNEDILAADNALLRSFPGCAVVVSKSTVLDNGFITNLASFLESASRESIKDFSAHTHKAGATISENRNTPEPALITSMLMALLEENGRRIAPTLLEKMVRDDVCWRDAGVPWRRLPYWLILRVAISRHLCIRLGGEIGRVEYKFFVAHLLGEFLSDVHGSLSIESLDYLRKKVSRRLVKVEVDRTRSQSLETSSRAEYLFLHLEPTLKQRVGHASTFIEDTWSDHKLKRTEKIPDLPLYASPGDLRLDLRVSYDHLQSILLGDSRPRRREIDHGSTINISQAKEHLNSFAQEHHRMIEEEHRYLEFCNDPFGSTSHESRTIIDKASQSISSYMDSALRLYDHNPQLLSTMIVTIMELWVRMDREACVLFPLLREYHPVFRPEMLDVLLTSHFEEMQRVQEIQLYLQERIRACGPSSLDIFADPVSGTFGHRFYEESSESSTLRSLHEEIESRAAETRLRKREEWEDLSLKYETLSKQIDQSTCVYLVDDDNPLSRGRHDDVHCSRCYMTRQLSKIWIKGYEHPLPSDQVIAKVVVFELSCPQSFATYRDSTWRIISKLALPPPEDTGQPKCTARNYDQLSDFANNSQMACTLASLTKPFLRTHYSKMGFPVEWESGRDGVCRPNALRLYYFDNNTAAWPSRRGFRPCFLPHVKLEIPPSSPFSSLVQDLSTNGHVCGPSSYEIVSTAAKCPPGINIHEYLAFQTITSGKSRRWLAILMELGSANLNFSNDATMLLLSYLTSHCGPPDESHDPLRMVHKTFRDEVFCHKLIQQLDQRLDSLSANWRETNLMETVISLTLRVSNFGRAAGLDSVFKEATSLLLRARDICARWFLLLRAETFKLTDPEAAQRFQKYTLWAGLLCKWTFALHTLRPTALSDSALKAYIQSSIMVHDSLMVKLSSLTRILRSAVVRDMRLSYRLYKRVYAAILAKPDVFRSSLKELWPEAEGSPRKFSHVTYEKFGWISCRASTAEESNEQSVWYNCIEGVLLVDGRLMGKLPNDPTKSPFPNELFGEQVLLAYPSDRRGMQYTLCVQFGGFQVHVGFSGRDVVVRAFRMGYSLQLIPREKFRIGVDWDLPGPLIDNCFHWLNLRNGQVLISKQPWPEYSFKGYTLDLRNRSCTRFSNSVVNPYCPLYDCATKILGSFEHRQFITVVQPGGRMLSGKPKKLQVELPRLQIQFHVNQKHMLQSPQLKVEIDQNQDAGTWYGLRSKLVCRSLSNPDHQSILVPIGNLEARVDGCHVEVRIVPTGMYGKFTVNKTLGRLDCASEPVLVYTKALLHAMTSFALPDRLTGRTGLEEAIEWLKSGMSQPWSPLGPGALPILLKIAQLTPRREYYPADLRVMRTDYWAESIPKRLQSSEYWPIVEKIMQTSQSLAVFATSDHHVDQDLRLPSIGDSHLHTRALLRQRALQRCEEVVRGQQTPTSRPYKSRDRPSHANIPHRNVLDITHSVRTWPQSLDTTAKLAQLLGAENLVGGFGSVFDKASLNDRLRTNIVQNWGSLVLYAKTARTKYDLMFLLGPIAFRLDVDLSLLRTLLAFAIFDDLQNLRMPEWEEFECFHPGEVPQLDSMLKLIKPFGAPAPVDDRAVLEEFANAKLRRKIQNERVKHEKKVEEDCKTFANLLLEQWPCLEPTVEGLSQTLLVDIGSGLMAVRAEWRRLFMNWDLSNHIADVQAILNRRASKTVYELPAPVAPGHTFFEMMRGGEVPDLGMLMQKPVQGDLTRQDVKTSPLSFMPPNGVQLHGNQMKCTNNPKTQDAGQPTWHRGLGGRYTSLMQKTTTKRSDTRVKAPDVEAQMAVLRLRTMTTKLRSSKSSVKKKYADDFEKSLAAFSKLDQPTGGSNVVMRRRGVNIQAMSSEVEHVFGGIRDAFDNATSAMTSRQIEWLKAGGLWPAVTKGTVLSQLGSVRGQKLFGSGMRAALIELGVKTTELQREIRLDDLKLKQNPGRYHEEERNIGHTNWSPSEHPDWLLLEIESNFMIRPVQIDVAFATISPESGSNSVLQMNMGQGKTSCIIPMVAAALADRSRLVRIVVPKALLQQTAQLLQARLGGILGRQVRHVPFSRRTPTTGDTIQLYHGIHRDMMKTAGIMICQPEHNMSFMLSGQQRLLDNKIAQATPMVRVQNWLTRVSRDILDESDYTLAVRTQLIYPSGSQMTVDGHPHRWLVTEAVLRLVDGHMFALSHLFPHSINVIRRQGGGFPLIFFLRPDVEDELVRLVTTDVCKGLGDILPMTSHTMPQSDRVAIKDFISATRPRPSSVKRIGKLCPDNPSIRQSIYLLRGLLVNRILMMVLKKRWNVEYGLHPKRDPIAVPFHAKGVPSEQSEWGHPDVAILFTCLAFYYDGVNVGQLKQCLDHILRSDDPSTEYDKWTKSTNNYPSSLRAWNSINVDDEVQLTEIWKVVRYNGVVVDYFLNNFVFPRHAKQFKVKLQSNGWDIPLFPLTEEPSRPRNLASKQAMKPLTTGFSGTNDNRTMLPLNIKQEDLPSLVHTSAEVLTYLLCDRNRRCLVPRQLYGPSFTGRATELDLLKLLKQQGIRVLIDAGAQILEMDNLTLAREWLKIDDRAAAALYFDEGNRPWVVSQQGKKTPLLASPFADDLNQCLVYLDEAHTRGTDLRLPPDARGALTLRLGQTKDHTVQAAMRLRQLGTTQSVSFFVPPEVHQSIADMLKQTVYNDIDSGHVIEWLLHNTCESIEQLQPLFYSQGIDFCRRSQAVLSYPDLLYNERQREKYVATIKQEEQQTLQQLYDPKPKNRGMTSHSSTNASLREYIGELNSRRKAFQDNGRAVHGSALQEVEQEREVAFEVESVRQVKKPQQFAACSFPGLQLPLEMFAKTGRIPADSDYFTHVFSSIAKTGLGKRFGVSRGVTESKLYVTAEFDKTIKHQFDNTKDNFLRPVSWVLWSPASETAVVVIPEEAEALMPMLRDARLGFSTHLLMYAAPITRKMLQFNNLDYYSIPSLPQDWKAPNWLRVELGLFAGRLYFEWDEYSHLCGLLGIEGGLVPEEEEEDEVLPSMDGAADEEVAEEGTTTNGSTAAEDEKRFAKKPLTFVQEWLAVRRRGQDFAHSPMGFLSQGKPLHAEHAFFTHTEEKGDDSAMAPVTHNNSYDGAGHDGDDDFYGMDEMEVNDEGDYEGDDEVNDEVNDEIHDGGMA